MKTVTVHFDVSESVKQMIFTNEITGQQFVFTNRPGNNQKRLPVVGSYTIEVIEDGVPVCHTMGNADNVAFFNFTQDGSYSELPLWSNYKLFTRCE